MTMIGIDPSEYSKPCHTNLSGAKPANAAVLADKDAEIARLLAENESLRHTLQRRGKSVLPEIAALRDELGQLRALLKIANNAVADTRAEVERLNGLLETARREIALQHSLWHDEHSENDQLRAENERLKDLVSAVRGLQPKVGGMPWHEAAAKALRGEGE
jgi:chromosome segregation ATPase